MLEEVRGWPVEQSREESAQEHLYLLLGVTGRPPEGGEMMGLPERGPSTPRSGTDCALEARREA